MSDKRIKVTDKRMFTPEGELREEYRELAGERRDEAPAAAPPDGGDSPAGSEPGAGAEPARPAGGTSAPPPAGFAEPGRPEAPPAASADDFPPSAVTPSFVDLVGLLAQPVAVYLGDAQLADGKSSENLEMARLHIDLLVILKEKTAGNLSVEEGQFLDGLLYELRMRYVQKSS